MKLRKLELFGFKSFYDKTSFDFSDGITAIVGPNGCGKSNIVDAVRWVLGEHAPSYLRSKALEDVIFAGSDAAGPLGMAEVTLTFGNEDGIAPPGYESYSEIQVTRRTFRDGESEFFINRVPCRLKDIAELFLDTGAGARGYAIVEQGRIMTIVNARPDEKRLIIEEAAGVAKFRVRRKEAERRMDGARQNLARVKDVLEEVRRQLGSLERQVRKAERYKALRDELRELDLRVAARRRRALAGESARIAKALAAAGAALAAHRAEIAGLEAGREAERALLAADERALADLRAAHGALKESVARWEAEWAGRRREEAGLRDLIAEAEGEAARLEDEIAELSAALKRGEAAAEQRKEELSAARRALGARKEAAEAARAEHLCAQEQSDRAKSDLVVRVSLHSNARSGAESLRRIIGENARAVSRKAEQIAEAEAAVRKAAEEHREAQASEAASREALAAAVKGWEEADARLGAVGARLEAAAEARRRIEGQLEALASRRATLSRIYAQRDWASAGVRAVLNHFSGGSWGEGGPAGGIYGVIADLIETEATYEKAVEAVLGDRIQSVVVRDQAEGLSALHYLKESREGRGAFVPVTIRSRAGEPAYLGEEGVIGALIDVVRAPPACGDLVRGLLGGTLLVRDIECAVRLWNRNGVWNAYVTLDGDLVTADGTLVGGAEEGQDSGVLAVKREIRELDREVEALSAEAARSRSEEDGARVERDALEEGLREAFARREEAAAALSQAETRGAVLEMALAQGRATALSLVEEREYLLAEAARMAADLAATDEAARETEQARGEEEDRVRVLAAAVETSREAMEAARDAFHAAEVEWTAMEEKERSERTLLAGIAGNLEEKRALVEERRRRKASYDEKRAALSEAAEADRSAAVAAAAEADRFEEEVVRKVGEAAARAEGLAGIEARLREARKREGEDAAAVSELRLAAQRTAMEIENLDGLIWQRYELHPAGLPSPPPDAGAAAADEEARAEEIRSRMSSIGDVNLASIEEHQELAERHAFLVAQKEDLEKSLEDLAKAIQRINRTTRERFADAFAKINARFQEVFPKLFLGGRAYLKLLDEENLLESGVEIVASPPGKKLQSLNLLSGGEKALTAISLIFSIFLVKPSPFCLLDEADAPLDDANIDRFNSLVRDMSADYQFLLITHNKRTMELADAVYGVTMEKPGISKVVSVRFRA